MGRNQLASLGRSEREQSFERDRIACFLERRRYRLEEALNGDGQSTPAVWGERVFLTTALDQGKQRVVMRTTAAMATCYGNRSPGPESPKKPIV